MWKYLFFGLLAFNVYRYFFPPTTYDICMTATGKTGVFCIPQNFKESESASMMSIARSRVGDSPRIKLSVVMVTASPSDLAQLFDPETMQQKIAEAFN